MDCYSQTRTALGLLLQAGAIYYLHWRLQGFGDRARDQLTDHGSPKGEDDDKKRRVVDL